MKNKKEIYSPVFEIDQEIIELVSKIINSININNINLVIKNVHLRKKNRLMSLQSTLAIENNALSLKQVTDIIDGKRVLGVLKEIQEVKNIYNAYKNIGKYNPYSINDFLLSHKYITSELVSQSGKFRNNDVGIYDGHGNVVHVGARPQYINNEVNGLFKWLKESNIHPIIKSCIFHFEIEVIHPFEDGNGRIGRLWQTVILNEYNKIFEYVPIETVIYHNQRKYYDVLNYCSKNNDSTKFIKFMLITILKSISDIRDTLNSTEKQILKLIENNSSITTDEIVINIGKTSRTVSRYIRILRENNIIRRIGSDKNGYWEIL